MHKRWKMPGLLSALFTVLLPPSGWAGMDVATICTVDTHPKHQLIDVYTPVAHFKGNTLLVVPDRKDRPTVTQVAPNGRHTTVFLDPQPDYVSFPDPHNQFSVGVDPRGYIHIAGDMHQFGAGHGRHRNYVYPDRYDDRKGAAILYWRSVRPMNISGGFEFRGAKNSVHALPGISWSYGRFFNDREGNLYYSARVRAFSAKDYNQPDARRGSMGVGVYRYDEQTETWSALGGHVPHPNPGNVRIYHDVLYWAHSGRPDTEHGYQAYQANLNFDINDRMHFSVCGHIGDGETLRLVYAYSDDKGQTWHKADGTRIPGVPLQGDRGAQNLADVVTDMNHGSIAKVIADRHGNPAIKMGSNNSGWFVFRNGKWTFDKNIPGTRMFQQPDGDLIIIADWGTWMLRDLVPPVQPEKIGRGISMCSQFGALSTGNLHGPVMNKEKDKVLLAEFRFTESE